MKGTSALAITLALFAASPANSAAGGQPSNEQRLNEAYAWYAVMQKCVLEYPQVVEYKRTEGAFADATKRLEAMVPQATAEKQWASVVEMFKQIPLTRGTESLKMNRLLSSV
jgi:hypothetical protein